MEKTIITYRGRKLFTLGHTGTFINYIFWFIFGCAWLAIGVYSFIQDGLTLISALGYILGTGIIVTAIWAMYVNRKEVIDNKRLAKERLKIDELISYHKSRHQISQKECHTIIQDSKEQNYLIDRRVWEIFSEVLMTTQSYTNKQLDLIKYIYDGMGIDKYFFELDNNLLKDKFFRGQKVIAIKKTAFYPMHVKLTIQRKMEKPSFNPNGKDFYICITCDTSSKRVVVAEDEIMDYDMWKESLMSSSNS